jgi:hypothetical protein
MSQDHAMLLVLGKPLLILLAGHAAAIAAVLVD